MSTKKSILYICSNALGENIQSLAAVLFLSKNYDVTLCFKKSKFIFFKDLDFIKNIIILPDNFQLSKSKDWFELKEFIDIKNYDFYTSHFDWIIQKTSFLGIKELPLIRGGFNFSFTENLLCRFGWDQKDESLSFYPKIRDVNPDNIKKIVVCLGSNDIKRKFPIEILNKFLAYLIQNFSSSYEIITIVNNIEQFNLINVKIDKILISQNTEQSAEEIISLFSSGVDICITPDSGIMHLALSFKTPTIDLETRERAEHSIPYIYFQKKYAKIYRKINSLCQNDCRARFFLEKDGEKILKEFKGWKYPENYPDNLECSKYKNIPCLMYGDDDIENINKIIKELLCL
jgi:ADP-heptose:LPS heptosyltransferase